MGLLWYPQPKSQAKNLRMGQNSIAVKEVISVIDLVRVLHIFLSLLVFLFVFLRKGNECYHTRATMGPRANHKIFGLEFLKKKKKGNSILNILLQWR